MTENDEIIAIIVSSLKTIKKNRKKVVSNTKNQNKDNPKSAIQKLKSQTVWTS
jgi:hypothetical protein